MRKRRRRKKTKNMTDSSAEPSSSVFSGYITGCPRSFKPHIADWIRHELSQQLGKKAHQST
jgi:hypothetical protein